MTPDIRKALVRTRRQVRGQCIECAKPLVKRPDHSMPLYCPRCNRNRVRNEFGDLIDDNRFTPDDEDHPSVTYLPTEDEIWRKAAEIREKKLEAGVPMGVSLPELM